MFLPLGVKFSKIEDTAYIIEYNYSRKLATCLIGLGSKS